MEVRRARIPARHAQAARLYPDQQVAGQRGFKNKKPLTLARHPPPCKITNYPRGMMHVRFPSFRMGHTPRKSKDRVNASSTRRQRGSTSPSRSPTSCRGSPGVLRRNRATTTSSAASRSAAPARASGGPSACARSPQGPASGPVPGSSAAGGCPGGIKEASAGATTAEDARGLPARASPASCAIICAKTQQALLTCIIACFTFEKCADLEL